MPYTCSFPISVRRLLFYISIFHKGLLLSNIKIIYSKMFSVITYTFIQQAYFNDILGFLVLCKLMAL